MQFLKSAAPRHCHAGVARRVFSPVDRTKSGRYGWRRPGGTRAMNTAVDGPAVAFAQPPVLSPATGGADWVRPGQATGA
jgi:hypothetical protein